MLGLQLSSTSITMCVKEPITAAVFAPMRYCLLLLYTCRGCCMCCVVQVLTTFRVRMCGACFINIPCANAFATIALPRSMHAWIWHAWWRHGLPAVPAWRVLAGRGSPLHAMPAGLDQPAGGTDILWCVRPAGHCSAHTGTTCAHRGSLMASLPAACCLHVVTHTHTHACLPAPVSDAHRMPAWLWHHWSAASPMYTVSARHVLNGWLHDPVPVLPCQL